MTTATNNNTLPIMIEKLWNEKGYEIKYLLKLTHKELLALYDTEFYYEEN